MTLETAAASTSAGSLVGRVIDGRYRLEEELGGGAAGTTHRARRAEDSRLVVLKLFDEDVSGDAVRRSRFEWEAATLAGLAHPNVVPILDYGVFAGHRYLVSEWLDGESLAQRMRRAQLPLTAAVGIIRQVLAALASVHSARLAHRNLKPTDVYLEWRKQGRERVKLLDFAPVLRPRAVTTGRGSYVPPEMALGEPLDARSDVYAVGALLSGMLHGGPPDVPVLAGPAAAGARKGPVVDSTLQGWIRRAMARDRQERFADAAEMLQQLIDLLPRDLRSPPDGYEASRVSSVSIPSPVRTDTRRNDTSRPDSSRSQVMRAETSASSASTTEPRQNHADHGDYEEPARVEPEPAVRAQSSAGDAKDSVSPETRAAFARSERARAFIEGRTKTRTRSATPTGQLSLPAVPESRAETTSAGWVIAEPAKHDSVERSVAEPAAEVVPSLVQPRIEPAAPAPAEPSAVEPFAADSAPLGAAPAVAQTQTIAPTSPPERTVAEREAAALVAAAESVAYDVDVASAVADQTAPVSLTPSTQPVQAEVAPSLESAETPAVAAKSLVEVGVEEPSDPSSESTLPATPSARPRASTYSSRPPNRKARREAARLAAMQDGTPTSTTLGHHATDATEAPAAKTVAPAAKSARKTDATPLKVHKVHKVHKVQRVERARPRTTDQGSVRDAVVGLAARWSSRVARNAKLTPAFARASVVVAGVACVVAISVVSLRSFDTRDGAGPGTVLTAVDSTSSPLVVSHDGLAGAAPSASETRIDPATAEPVDTAAAEAGNNARVPALNPWKDDPLPPELEGIPALANKGDPGEEAVIRKLREYSRLNEGDARGLLLIGRLYMNRYWRTDALTHFQLAVERNPAVRGAPEIMAALLDLIVTGKATEPAEAFILRFYGREALPAIEAELEKLQRPMSIQRLSAVRAKLLDR
ncbi:MAG TPA: protein kinase [Polyangiales bacterium]|nr:protein kinase [Polyangiales bacterium]